MIRPLRTRKVTMDLERTLLFSFCLIPAILAACTVSVDPADTAQEPSIEAPDMNAYWAAHVAHRRSGDLEAATDILAEDCVLLEPFRPPLSGRDNIASKMRQDLTMAEIHDVSIESQEIYHHGSILVDFGTFSETFSLAGEETRRVVEGSYTALLEQNPSGNWKVKRFMVLPSTPPPPS